MVPVIGVEPIRYFYHRILSPARLPVSPHRREIYYIIFEKSAQLIFYYIGLFLLKTITLFVSKPSKLIRSYLIYIIVKPIIKKQICG